MVHRGRSEVPGEERSMLGRERWDICRGIENLDLGSGEASVEGYDTTSM